MALQFATAFLGVKIDKAALNAEISGARRQIIKGLSGIRIKVGIDITGFNRTAAAAGAAAGRSARDAFNAAFGGGGAAAPRGSAAASRAAAQTIVPTGTGLVARRGIIPTQFRGTRGGPVSTQMLLGGTVQRRLGGPMSGGGPVQIRGLLGTPGLTDAQVRAALNARFGGPRTWTVGGGGAGGAGGRGGWGGFGGPPGPPPWMGPNGFNWRPPRGQRGGFTGFPGMRGPGVPRGRMGVGQALMQGNFGGFLQGSAQMATGILGAHAAMAMLTMPVSALKSAGEFQQKMIELQVVTGASAKEMEKLKNEALTLGKTGKFGVVETADALVKLAKAGLSAEESTKALPTVLNFATASGMNLEDAANSMVRIKNQMGLGVEDFGHLSDVLVRAADSSTAELDNLTTAFSYTGQLSHLAGLNIEEVAAALAKLTDSGMEGSRAGTGLTQLLKQFSDPKKMDAMRGALGKNIQLFDDSGTRLRPLADIIDDVNAAFGDTATAEDKLEMSLKIFGTRGGPAFANLLMAGGDSLREFEKRLGTGATAADRAKSKMSGLKGAAAAFGNTMQGVAVQALDPFLGALTNIVTTATKAANSLSQLKTAGAGLSFLGAVSEGITGANINPQNQSFGEIGALANGAANIAGLVVPLLMIGRILQFIFKLVGFVSKAFMGVSAGGFLAVVGVLTAIAAAIGAVVGEGKTLEDRWNDFFNVKLPMWINDATLMVKNLGLTVRLISDEIGIMVATLTGDFARAQELGVDKAKAQDELEKRQGHDFGPNKGKPDEKKPDGEKKDAEDLEDSEAAAKGRKGHRNVGAQQMDLPAFWTHVQANINQENSPLTQIAANVAQINAKMPAAGGAGAPGAVAGGGPADGGGIATPMPTSLKTKAGRLAAIAERKAKRASRRKASDEKTKVWLSRKFHLGQLHDADGGAVVFPNAANPLGFGGGMGLPASQQEVEDHFAANEKENAPWVARERQKIADRLKEQEADRKERDLIRTMPQWRTGPNAEENMKWLKRRQGNRMLDLAQQWLAENQGTGRTPRPGEFGNFLDREMSKPGRPEYQFGMPNHLSGMSRPEFDAEGVVQSPGLNGMMIGTQSMLSGVASSTNAMQDQAVVDTAKTNAEIADNTRQTVEAIKGLKMGATFQ